MQLASHGARAVARKAPPTARSIHIPSAVRPQTSGLGRRLLTQTRLALGRFVTHLTTPGTGSVSVTRSFHAANPSIQQRLSFAARTTLSRPLQPRFLPRGPLVPRTMTQIGLGTARNFSSGRPIFQQLADNVPVVGRAFYEADWEINMQKERENMRRPSKKRAPKAKATKEMLKPKKASKSTPAASAVAESDIEHYFAAPSVPAVTTHLLVPLAPTPTARAPLPEFPAERLPLPALLAIHDEHETHSLRVASLFQRLDSADVWSRGATCAAYASSAGPDGVCTVLRVAFSGWSKAAVRGIIGESGTGWCVLEETHDAMDAYETEADDAFSETSSILSGLGREDTDPVAHHAAIDPAQSFVLPTLDFSSSFLASAAASGARSPASDMGAWSDSDAGSELLIVEPPSENGWFESQTHRGNPWVNSDSDLESRLSSPWLDSGSENGWLDAPAPSERSWLGFSSDFGHRQRLATPEPLESAFA
ncbi:hypothetical protein C8R43DRAFT_1051477 [Mycena crocata]|nr:hypothetical protein C8R43DRAFT_1051477 [Mycena crocata]